LENYIPRPEKRYAPQNGTVFHSGEFKKPVWVMKKLFQYQQCFIPSLELEIYSNLLETERHLLQCIATRNSRVKSIASV